MSKAVKSVAPGNRTSLRCKHLTFVLVLAGLILAPVGLSHAHDDYPWVRNPELSPGGRT